MRCKVHETTPEPMPVKVGDLVMVRRLGYVAESPALVVNTPISSGYQLVYLDHPGWDNLDTPGLAVRRLLSGSAVLLEVP